MVIRFERVAYRYEGAASTTMTPALDALHLQLDEGGFIVISGPPGSGKSTLLQLFNGILRPTEGEVQILDFKIIANEHLVKPNALRQKVGLVFQFPERQLFEATVREELSFGPRNFGAAKEAVMAAVHAVCQQLELPEAILDRSPFSLSGGQMRKVAIGAVLTANPDILVLDEPTASLDPRSRIAMLFMLRRLCDEQGKTIVLVTHRLEEVLPYADRYVLLQRGKLVFHGDVDQLLASAAELDAQGLQLPVPLRLLSGFARHHGAELPGTGRHALTPQAIAAYMQTILERRDATCATR